MVVSGVKLPVEANDFVTPSWHTLFEFYPKYRRKAGKKALSIQEYILVIAKLLEGERGRTADRWIERMTEHFGIDYLAMVVDAYGD